MIDSELYSSYRTALLEGNKQTCLDIVKHLLDSGIPVKTIYFDLFHRSMYEVGSLWEQNQISVATEHLATAITEMMLTEVYPLIFSQEHHDRHMLVSCGMNELHQLGAKMVADYCEFLGWNTQFLGANTPVDALVKLIEEKQPDVVGLLVSLTSHLDRFSEAVEQITTASPRTSIIAGGRAFSKDAHENLPCWQHCSLIDGFDALETYLKSIACIPA